MIIIIRAHCQLMRRLASFTIIVSLAHSITSCSFLLVNLRLSSFINILYTPHLISVHRPNSLLLRHSALCDVDAKRTVSGNWMVGGNLCANRTRVAWLDMQRTHESRFTPAHPFACSNFHKKKFVYPRRHSTAFVCAFELLILSSLRVDHNFWWVSSGFEESSHQLRIDESKLIQHIYRLSRTKGISLEKRVEKWEECNTMQERI